jgi:hypothetical protein
MKGTARAKAKWSFIQKTVDVEIDVSNTGFAASIVLTSVNNKPNIRISEFSLSISNVHIKISDGLIGKIVDFLVNLLKGYACGESISR